jgi:hypothetical protein
MKNSPWTPEKDAELLALFEEGYGDEDVAVKIGRTLGATRTRRFELARPTRLRRHANQHFTVPFERIVDRANRKAAAEQRDYTSTFFGDPPPGYSALDRRGQR